MDLINTGSDPWILEYDACEKLSREIMEHLNARNSEKTNSREYDSLSAKIRLKLKQFSNELSVLDKKLNSSVSNVTLEEKERRRRQVETLKTKEIQLRDYFSLKQEKENSDEVHNANRNQLLEKRKKDNMFADMGTTSWGESSSNNDEKTVEEMKVENERLLKEQDEGLESLLNIVIGQKRIATSINDEVERHNEILVDIADNMERVDGRLHQATNMVTVIGKKDRIWGYWIVAFLLFIAIIGVAFA